MTNDLMTNDPMTNDKDGGWENIGFVHGNGTSSSPNNYNYSDNSAKNGFKYKYRLKQIDNNGDYKYSSEIEVLANLAPANYALSQNYPNPFNPSTMINYQVAEPGKVLLTVYDMLGKKVSTLVDENKAAGRYSVKFNASNLSSGTYIYELKINNFVSRNKMLLLK